MRAFQKRPMQIAHLSWKSMSCEWCQWNLHTVHHSVACS
jgi:hypothetical protein